MVPRGRKASRRIHPIKCLGRSDGQTHAYISHTVTPTTEQTTAPHRRNNLLQLTGFHLLPITWIRRAHFSSRRWAIPHASPFQGASFQTSCPAYTVWPLVFDGGMWCHKDINSCRVMMMKTGDRQHSFRQGDACFPSTCPWGGSIFIRYRHIKSLTH